MDARTFATGRLHPRSSRHLGGSKVETTSFRRAGGSRVQGFTGVGFRVCSSGFVRALTLEVPDSKPTSFEQVAIGMKG